MLTELPVLQALRTILESGSYEVDIDAFYIRPDDLSDRTVSDPNFATVGLKEDVEKIFDYNSLGNQQQASYTVAIRFYLVEKLYNLGSKGFMDVEACARPIISEVARLMFANPDLSKTVIETGSIRAGPEFLYLKGKQYTGIEIEMPVIQEI